jgi:hypothetical protein
MSKITVVQKPNSRMQHGLERIERAPLEVALPLEDQSVADGHGRCIP